MGINEEVKANIDSTNPTGAGIPSNDPAAMEALSGVAKSRGGAGFAVQSGIMGAGMGAKAAEGAMNPLTAFIQGAAAGLQAPAQLFAQKQAQVKSTLDAMPFGARFPDMAEKYPALAGMPSVLGLETLKQIAIDTQKVIEEHKAKNQITPDLIAQIDASGKLQNLEPIKAFHSVAPAYRELMRAQGAGGDKTMVLKFAQMLIPSLGRLSEGTMDAMDVSSTFGKFTSDAWSKALKGELSPEDRKKLREEATRIYNERRENFERVAAPVRTYAARSGLDLNILLPESPETKTPGELITTEENGEIIVRRVNEDGMSATRIK